MSLPVIAYVLQPDQVIFTPTTENGPIPGIYAASDFIAKWRDWDAGTAGRPARAWHTLFDAVLKAGDRFDFFLLDEALKSYGEELFPDPQERLEWCIRTAIGLERWDEAKRLINELEGYALPPSGSADQRPEVFSSPVRRLRAEWAYARRAAGMEDDILVPTLVDELFALGETQKAEHLIARAWPAVFSALLSFLQPEENAGKGSDAQEAAQWRRTILSVGQNCTLMTQCSSALSFHQRLWRAAAFLYFSQDERDVETGLNELISLTSLLRPAEEVLEVLALMTVVLATAGYTDNVTFRRMVDPRLTKEFASAACEYSPQDGSGTLAAIKVGAGLWGLTNAYTERPISLTRGAVIGVRDTYLRWAPESPIFPLVKHSGVALRNWQNAIVVNWVGKRFFEETSSAGLTADSGKLTSYGTANSTRGLMNGTNGAFFKELDKNPYVQGNWRNIDRTKYNPINFIAAALQINEGSHAPDWSAGPQWAIFDSEAIKRERMHTDEKSVDPEYFFKADTIEELAEKINTNPYMSHKMDPKILAETVAKYNSYVDAGADPDFDKPKPQYKIEKGPFYAAWTSVTLHDCYCGLHVNNACEVLDWEGEKIPGLYAAGEVTGGSSMHGLSRGLIQAYVLGDTFASLKK